MDFLDVVFNLEDGSFCPYVKPNTTTNYVSCKSSHPATVLKTIPIGVSKRLSTNSSSKEAFESHTEHFKDALVVAGHNTPLEYFEDDLSNSRKKRKRNVMYFNPPWSSNISTNIGKLFLSLVRKHFGKGKPLYHLFNTKKLKVSYSTTQNMQRLISGHNARVLRMSNPGRSAQDSPNNCDCEDGPSSCNLGGHCQTSDLVYKAEVEVNGSMRTYIGQTTRTFKQRVGTHNSNIRTNRKATSLATYVVDLKRKGVVNN